MKNHLLTAPLFFTALLFCARDLWSDEQISYTLEKPGRVSLAVYSEDGELQLRSLLVGEWLEAGKHKVRWDGLDRDGRALEPGSYQWRLITSPGLEADYLGVLGANPKAGGWTHWVGNHTGPTCIAFGPEGICIGSGISEGPPRLLMLESDATTQAWRYPHLGWEGIGPVSMAMTDSSVVYVRQDCRVFQRDLKTGNVTGEFDALWAGDERPNHLGGRLVDLDVDGAVCVISHFDHDAVRWYDLESNAPEKKGAVVREVAAAKPRCVAAGKDGTVFVVSQGSIARIGRDDQVTVVLPREQLVDPVALAFDPADDSLLVANGAPDHRILRISTSGKLLAEYGEKGGRKPGRYKPDRFVEVVDIAAAKEGSFFVVEGASPFHHEGSNHGGLRRVAHVGADGDILHEWYGGVGFFNTAAAVPGNPREVFQNISDSAIARYNFDPDTGTSRITHVFLMPEEGWGDGLFPGPNNFPMYRPVKRRGQLYLVSNGRYVLRPNLETGELIPVALAAFKRYGGWKEGDTPQPIIDAAAHHQLDLNKPETDAFTWSDADGDGKLDSEEFRFAETGPGAGYAFLDDDFNLYFGYYQAPNHVYTGKNWVNFDFEQSLYARLPNDATDADVPVWDWNHVTRSEEKIPEDPLGVFQRLAPRALYIADDRIHVLLQGGGGGHIDSHPDRWPTAQTTHNRIITGSNGRVVQVLGKHKSEGPPKDAQFRFASHLLGTVGSHLVVCDRMEHTTAWTKDGLLIGTLLDRHVEDELPPHHYVPGGKDGEHSVIMGDDWMAAGSIYDLGKGEALWFAPGGDRTMVFKVRGWNGLQRQSGAITLTEKLNQATTDGAGLQAEYFANPKLSGEPAVTRTDPRLWFSDDTTGGQIVAAWSKDGPCPGIAAGEPFSVRWSGTITAPLSEPFWLRLYNHRAGKGHTPNVQSWENGRGYARVFLNNQLVLDKWEGSPTTNPAQTPPIFLEAGQTYDLRVEYAQTSGKGAQFSFSWCSYTGEWMRVPTQYLHPDRELRAVRPRITVSAVRAETAEASPQPGVVRFALDRTRDEDVTVGYRFSGTAAPRADYEEPSGRVTIHAGKLAAEIAIKPRDDRRIEAAETCIVTLKPSPGYTGDGSAGQSLITIADNDNTLIDADLKLYYTFDDTDFATSDIRNEVSLDHTGIVRHFYTPSPRATSGPAGYGDAISFPQGRESVHSEDIPDAGDYSVTIWFQTQQKTCGICIAGSGNFYLEDGAFKVLNGGWPSEQPAGGNLADIQWHHAVFTWKREERKQRLYVDGKLVTTNTGPGGGSGLQGQVTLGYANKGGRFTGGNLDEFRIYSRCLTDKEVKTLWEWQAR